MIMKLCFSCCSAAVILCACGTLNAVPTATFTSETITNPVTSTPSTTQPADPYEGWISLESSEYTLMYPSSYYTPTSTDPVIFLADTKTTYDSWVANSTMQTDGITNNDELLIQFISLVLDRKLDPYNSSSLLATPKQALQREINRAIGIPYLVSGSTNVPWENANGGTYDGGKWFEPNVTYLSIMLGTTNAAKIIRDNYVYYFILNPNDDSYYVRIIIQPASSTLMTIADQILSTFKFTK